MPSRSNTRDYYQLLGIHYDAPYQVVIDAYEARVQCARGSNWDYDDPTPENRAKYNAELEELREAVDTLTDCYARARYDDRLFSSVRYPSPANTANAAYANAGPAAASGPGPGTAAASANANAAAAATGRSGSSRANLEQLLAIYPDFWNAMHDGRYRSDGTSWRAPRPRDRRGPRGVDRYVPGGGRRSPRYEAYEYRR